MLPWMHINTTPMGEAQPCCISDPAFIVGDSRVNSLMEIVNSDKMNQLRLNMLSGTPSGACATCYKHEEHGISSFRTTVNRDYGKFYDDLVPLTNTDGSLQEFKMKYFDIRFSNICNFKCRTCNETFSSQWEMENKKIRIHSTAPKIKNNNKEFLQQVLDQIPNIQTAYFAGGEPLITEEHYIMLEEMIRQGRTDIGLMYNTNISNLKYKNKDLLDLWSRFTLPITIGASVDHVGKRAEYIRNGTVWAEVEENYKKLQTVPNLILGINTVLSIYNFMTFDTFYQYLFDQGMYTPEKFTNSVYKMTSPTYLSPLILPKSYKTMGVDRIRRLAANMRMMSFTEHSVNEVSSIIPWIESEDLWDAHKAMFKQETIRLDALREEDFCKTFPELSGLL